jgi:hypothetical protein
MSVQKIRGVSCTTSITLYPKTVSSSTSRSTRTLTLDADATPASRLGTLLPS